MRTRRVGARAIRLTWSGAEARTIGAVGTMAGMMIGVLGMDQVTAMGRGTVMALDTERDVGEVGDATPM